VVSRGGAEALLHCDQPRSFDLRVADMLHKQSMCCRFFVQAMTDAQLWGELDELQASVPAAVKQ
jgi:hypothetical protein